MTDRKKCKVCDKFIDSNDVESHSLDKLDSGFSIPCDPVRDEEWHLWRSGTYVFVHFDKGQYYGEEET